MLYWKSAGVFLSSQNYLFLLNVNNKNYDNFMMKNQNLVEKELDIYKLASSSDN